MWEHLQVDKKSVRVMGEKNGLRAFIQFSRFECSALKYRFFVQIVVCSNIRESDAMAAGGGGVEHFGVG